MLFNTIFGSLVFLINNTALLYISHLLTRRFLPNAPPAVRLVAIGAFFYAFITVLFQALSPFHAISKTWVTVSCLSIALVTHFLWGRQRDFNADIEPIRIWLKDGLNSKWAALIVICGFVVILSFSRALLMPPLAWDCLTYHLTFAALWVKTGTLLLFKAPDQIQGCAHMPINGELFAAWFLLPFRTDLLVNIMNFPITFLGGISCYAIARELGLSRKESSFAPALICFAPMIYAQLTTEYVDNVVFAFCVASVLFTLRYLRWGNLYDNYLGLISGGILIGTKYTSIPAFAIIFFAMTLKTIYLPDYSKMRKITVVFLGILIVCCLGGRKYIQNSIEAGNPLYPFPLKVFQYELFEGYPKLEEEKELISKRITREGLDKFSLWETEFVKFSYQEVTAGPKFLLFLILGCISLFIKPPRIPKRLWFFMTMMWVVPILIHYLDSSADIARIGSWVKSSTRYISPFIALFTIQGLLVFHKIGKSWGKIDILLVIFIIWDLLNVRSGHNEEVTVSYPLLVPLVFFGFIFFSFVKSRRLKLNQKASDYGNARIASNMTSSFWRDTNLVKGVTYGITLLISIGALYLLQTYRDNTRYSYYQKHEDFHFLPRNYVDAWDFLDKKGESNIVAMARGWQPESHIWFFYPLLGKHLQNDIVYVSAKYKGETPTWLDRGLLRGEDFSIWLANLKRKKVDYILIVEPWPIELTWVRRYPEKFKLVFLSEKFRIFQYLRDEA